MSFKKKFLKNILISAGFNYASQGILFLSTIITSRLIGPELYGFVGLITIFTGFLLVFSDSGISLAVIRSDLGFSYHKSVDTLALFIGIALCVITCIISYPVALIFNNKALIIPMMVMSLNYIFKSMTLVRMALLTKDLNFKIAGQVTISTVSVTVFFTIVMAFYGFGYWALIVPQIIANIFSLFLLEFKVKLGFKVYPLPYLKVAYRHSWKTISNLMGFNMINYWARNSDNLIVGKFYGNSNLGVYNRAYSLLTIPLSLITGLIGTVLYPSLNRVRDSMDSIRNEYLFILKMISYLSYPLTFILVLFPSKLVLLLWGSNWIIVGKLLPYFGLLIFSQSLLSTAGNVLVLVKEEPVLRKSGWIGAAVIICGICYGAFYSFIAIAQFYALAFILIVLPFNVFYIFIRTLKFGVWRMLIFWGPTILLSLAIWLSCYYELEILKISSLLILLISLILRSPQDFKKIAIFLLSTLSNKRQKALKSS